jgi:mitogen-activated protein kinase organizer 1
VEINGVEIIAGSVDGFIRVYDVRKSSIVIDRIGQPVTSVRLSNDKNCLLTSTLDSSIRLLDKESGEVLATYRGQEYKNSEFRLISTLSYTDAYVISGSEDGKICCWDLVEVSSTHPRLIWHEVSMLTPKLSLAWSTIKIDIRWCLGRWTAK